MNIPDKATRWRKRMLEGDGGNNGGYGIDIIPDDEDEDEADDVWGRCWCGEPLRYSDGDFCSGCGNPIDDENDAI